MPTQTKTIATIDKFIYGFVILFIISLTNSIFVNQIGYFFALFLLIIRYAMTRENKFEKNGLEIAFILFLAAEFISALFSINHTDAFRLFFKRLVLIPIVYTIIASVDDAGQAKSYFKFYIGAALLTMIVYIVIAYEHFIAQLYSIESKGPSPFQYVMTAGGLMSFTTIFLFALLINEKGKIKIRLFYLAAFLISSVALFASYTRAAWLGAATGILVVIIMKRKWIILIPVVALVLFALFYFKNDSEVYTYKLKAGILVKDISFRTNGRASKVLPDGQTILVADHQKGIAVYDNAKLLQEIETPSPAVEILKWTEDLYISHLIDSRILLLKKGSDNRFKIQKSFYTPGNTIDLKIRNNNLYVADLDSGLSIFKNPLNISQRIHLMGMSGITNFDCDSAWFVSFMPSLNKMKLYSMRDDLPIEATDSVTTKSPMGFLWLDNNRIFFQSEDEFFQYLISDGKIRKVNSQKIKGIFRLSFDKEKIYACSMNGIVYSSDNTLNHPILFREIASAGFSPTDFRQSDQTFYFSYYKRNRLTSIFDPYHETNIERIDQWRTGLKIFADQPLFGIGDIDLNKVYAQYKDRYLKETFGHLHNNYIQFLVVLGAFGFAMVMFMLAKIFLMNLKIYKTVKDVPFVSSYALGATAAFVGFLFSGLGEWNFGDQEIITMVWFTLGLNIAFYKAHLKSLKSGTEIVG
ncbi:hypothetical protein C0389_01255 [bacterium]|nr:hypothetical protein [bacterium]